MKAHPFNPYFARWRHLLGLLLVSRLNELLWESRNWFEWDEDQFQKAVHSPYSKPKIDLLMDADPIFADGGLADFLITNKVIKKETK